MIKKDSPSRKRKREEISESKEKEKEEDLSPSSPPSLTATNSNNNKQTISSPEVKIKKRKIVCNTPPPPSTSSISNNPKKVFASEHLPSQVVYIYRSVFNAIFNHAFSDEINEIMGLLGGKVVDGRVFVTHMFPCARKIDTIGMFRVETTSNEQIKSMKYFEKENVENIGWYHSHPRIMPTPSSIDIGMQNQYQMHGKHIVGIICTPFFNKISVKNKNDFFFCVFRSDGKKDSIRVPYAIIKEDNMNVIQQREIQNTLYCVLDECIQQKEHVWEKIGNDKWNKMHYLSKYQKFLHNFWISSVNSSRRSLYNDIENIKLKTQFLDEEINNIGFDLLTNNIDIDDYKTFVKKMKKKGKKDNLYEVPPKKKLDRDRIIDITPVKKNFPKEVIVIDSDEEDDVIMKDKHILNKEEDKKLFLKDMEKEVLFNQEVKIVLLKKDITMLSESYKKLRFSSIDIGNVGKVEIGKEVIFKLEKQQRGYIEDIILDVDPKEFRSLGGSKFVFNQSQDSLFFGSKAFVKIRVGTFSILLPASRIINVLK